MADLDDLARDLATAADAILEPLRAVVHRGANNVKRDARAAASGIRHAPTYPYTIGYDYEESADELQATIGPDVDLVVGGGPKQTPGNLGVILEFGTATSGPIPHILPAGEREEPRFERAARQAVDRVLRASRL